MPDLGRSLGRLLDGRDLAVRTSDGLQQLFALLVPAQHVQGRGYSLYHGGAHAFLIFSVQYYPALYAVVYGTNEAVGEL